MTVLGLDHVNIAGPAALIESVRTFYVDVLGLVDGERPSFRTRGYWLYAGGQAIVHLTIAERAHGGSSSLDHFALRCEGLETLTARRERLGVEFTLDPARPGKASQLFLRDPAGVGVELNFPGGV